MYLRHFRSIIALTLFCLIGYTNSAHATVIPVGDGNYEVSYGINMTPGSSNGSDIESVFIFEWNDNNFSADFAGTISGTGNTYLSHVIDFEPTMALVLGYGAGVTGIGDEKDHIYSITSIAFSETVGGLKWSEAFPGTSDDPRLGHSSAIKALIDAETAWNADPGSSSNPLNTLINFVKTDAYRAAFDPAQGFVVLEWSTCPPGTVPPNCIPVGVPIPEPTAYLLFALGLAGLGFSRRKKT